MARLSGDPKANYINRLFTSIAPCYDVMNRLMSFGRDRVWRRAAAEAAQPARQGRGLDVATGTAELAIELATRSGRVVALDMCSEMMNRGRAKVARQGLKQGIDFVLGDALALPFQDPSFACVVTGFAMRNVADIDGCLAELHRVVEPGGRVVCLEMTMPESRLVRFLYWAYLSRIVPLLGSIISRRRSAYSYLPWSLSYFLSAEEFKKAMESSGLTEVSYRRLSLGTIALHTGLK